MKPVSERLKPHAASQKQPASQREPGSAELVSESCKSCLVLPKLTLARVQPYLDANNRDAASLLAGSWAALDPGLLEEAQAKYPNSPQVNLVAYFSGRDDRRKPASAMRRSSLERLKQSDPGNSLGNYLSASDYFKLDQTDMAVEELKAATAKASFNDYSAEFIQKAEEVWQAAGYTEAKAKAIASARLNIEALVDVKRLGKNLASLASAYHQAGDVASARAILRIAATLGAQLDQPCAAGLVRNLAGLRIEAQVLGAMPPTTPYDDSGRTVADRLDKIAQRRESLMALSEQGVKAQETAADSDLVIFYNQQTTLGSENALRWLVGGEGMPIGHNEGNRR